MKIFKELFESIYKMDFPELRQSKSYTCGVSAMQAVLIYYGFDVRENEIERLAGTTQKGTSPEKLKKVADNYKLEYVEKENLTINDIKNYINNEWPTIVCLQAWADKKDLDYTKEWKNGHYVIPIGYNDNMIFFEDPASPNLVYLSYEEFNNRWHDISNGDVNKKLNHWGLIFTKNQQNIRIIKLSIWIKIVEET